MNMPRPHNPGLRVTKLLIYESGTYEDQFRRPYTTQLDGDTYKAIGQAISSTPHIVGATLAGLAGQFLQPQATPEKAVGIVNGFDIRRGLFMMEVDFTPQTIGQVQKLMVLGYTDHPGFTPAGSIDPGMVFYVNSTAQIRELPAATPMGYQRQTTVAMPAQVIADNNFGTMYSSEKEYRLRPEEVYCGVSKINSELGERAMDLRAVQTQTAVKSLRRNALPSAYVATILETQKNALQTDEYGQGLQEVLSTARGMVAEPLAGQDPFLSAIANLKDGHTTNYFTYAELCRLDPNVPAIVALVLRNEQQARMLHQRGIGTQHWGGSDRATLVATTLSQAVPGLMMQLGLTQLAFESTNRTLTGEIVTVVEHVQGFSNIDLSPYIEQFKFLLPGLILKDISYGGQSDFALKMQVDLLLETWISVSVDGQPPVDYVVPSFCDALMTPVLTSSEQHALQLASDFDQLFGALGPQTSSMGYQTPQGGTPFGQM